MVNHDWDWFTMPMTEDKNQDAKHGSHSSVRSCWCHHGWKIKNADLANKDDLFTGIARQKWQPSLDVQHSHTSHGQDTALPPIDSPMSFRFDGHCDPPSVAQLHPSQLMMAHHHQDRCSHHNHHTLSTQRAKPKSANLGIMVSRSWRRNSAPSCRVETLKAYDTPSECFSRPKTSQLGFLGWTLLRWHPYLWSLADLAHKDPSKLIKRFDSLDW